MERETIFSLFEIVKYGGNGFTGIVLVRIIAFIFAWCSIFFCLQYKNRFTKFEKLFSPKGFTIVYIIGAILYSIQCIYFRRLPYNLLYIKNIISVNIETIQNLYKEDMLSTSLKNYEDYVMYEQGDKKDFNVILVFAESLSAVDSARLGGNNNMPYFDKIQESGITFTNFIAHGISSILSHITTFLGVPPLKDAFFEYSNLKPLPNFLNNMGYHTIYISAAKLSFLNERSYLDERGFQEIIGEEEFEKNKKYAFSAAPDGDLYEKVLEVIKNQKQKYFIGLNTISFHTPYLCPYGDTEKECLKYSDEKLYDFYTSLVNIGFFDNGILIIVGDHRKREPVEAGEFDIFGETWRYRTVATVVGSGIEAGSINENIIQHSDLCYSLKKLLGNDNVELSRFYNDAFSFKSNRNRGVLVGGEFVIPGGETYKMLTLKDLKEYNDEIYSYYITLKNYFLKKSMIRKDLSS